MPLLSRDMGGVAVIDGPFDLPLRALNTCFARGRGRDAFGVDWPCPASQHACL